MTQKKENRSDKPIRTALDEKSIVLFFEDMPLVPPDGVGVFDEPTRCRKVNLQWDKLISGAVRSQLLTIAAWSDAQDESYSGIQEVLKYLSSDDCGGDCTIEVLLSDDEFFQDEYIPQVFGDYVSGQAAHETELTTDYDGTPQSIGELIPADAPNPTEKNALCYAITKFVRLYCSQKVCTIQAKNFLQVAWNNLQNTMNDVYNQVVDWMVVYTPGLFSCFVDDSEALTVLLDESAQEELGCFLYDELQSVVMSQSHFDDALLAAAMSLSGNAQKIACIMNQDNSTLLYLHFLETYNIALQRNGSEALDCPCESGLYRLWVWDFTQGQGEFIINAVSPSFGGTFAGLYWEGIVVGGTKQLSIQQNLDPDWIMHGWAMVIERTGTNNVPSQDHRTLQGRIQRNSNTGLATFSTSMSGGTADGITRHQTNLAFGASSSNFSQLVWSAGVTGTAPEDTIKLHRVEILFAADAAKGGYLVNSKDMATYG